MAFAIRPQLPWWFKIGAKIVLSRLPISYDQCRRFGVFRHGAMLNTEYARDVFNRHYSRAESSLPRGFSVLEVGPGDSLATAIIAAARGAGAIYLLDVGAFAQTSDVAPYNRLAERLLSLGFSAPGAPYASVNDMLLATRTVYLTDGLISWRSIPSRSVDFAFSHAALEHNQTR